MTTTTTTATKTVVNNEGETITVSLDCYNEMQRDYDAGVWMDIVNDIEGNPHCVIIPDNFAK